MSIPLPSPTVWRGPAGLRNRLRRARAYCVLALATFGAALSAQTPTTLTWDANSVSNYGPSPWATTSTTPSSTNLTVVGWTRGSGVSTTGTAAGSSWGGTNWNNANAHATVTITPQAGHSVSLGSFNLFYRRSAQGPGNGSLQYSLANGPFVHITTLSYASSASGGASIPSVDLSSVEALQNVAAGTSIRLRILNTNAESAGGTWYINRSGASIQATVRVLPVINTTPASVPAFSTMTSVPSAPASFTVNANGLTETLLINAPNGFELKDQGGSSYSSSLSIAPTSGSVAQRTIQVRASATEAGSFSGNITCSSAGATSRTIGVQATVAVGNTRISLTPATGTIAENAGSYPVTISLVNPDPTAATTVELVRTSNNADRVGDFSSSLVTFPAGSAADQVVQLPISDNGYWDRGATVSFVLRNAQGGSNAVLSADSISVISITEVGVPNLWVSELNYQAASGEANFIELYNGADQGVDLHDFRLEFAYDDHGAVSMLDEFDLPSIIVPAHSYFVISGSGTIAHSDLRENDFVANIFGGADQALAIGLRNPFGTLIDGLSFEGNVPGYGMGNGSALIDPADLAGVTLTRVDGAWMVGCSTPGADNSAPGLACDDGDPNTLLDTIQADCICAGTPIPSEDCLGVEGGPAMPGTPCDDGDSETRDDIWTSDCTCAGTPIVRDCLGVENGEAIAGTPCDDENVHTINDEWTSDCSCTGTLVPAAPTVVTLPATAISGISATIHGRVNDQGSSAISDVLLVWNNVGNEVEVNTILQADSSFSAVLNGLIPNTTYTYTAYAMNGEDIGVGSELGFTTTALDAPLALTAIDTLADGFTALWHSVAGATGYRIDVSSSPTFGTSNTTSDLFFSEYLEGNSNNKFYEIFNGTGAAVDLSDYVVYLYANGSTEPTQTEQLSGTLAHGGVLVFRNPNASTSVYSGSAISTQTTFYNGDDALTLYRHSTSSYVDIFGSVGNRVMWSQNGNAAVDQTLIRRPEVSGGITVNPAAHFPTLGTEWIRKPIDDGSDLGRHDFPLFVADMLPGYSDLAVSDTSLVITGLARGNSYYYRVRAVLDEHVSANSGTISVLTGTTDCAGVFNGTALPGTPCDDGDANTGNDIFGEDCLCAGTPIEEPGCEGETVVVRIMAGADNSGFSWSIVDASEYPVATGHVPEGSEAGTWIETSVCLSGGSEERFGLVLESALGNGLNGGKWEMRDSEGRLISGDVFASGQRSPRVPTPGTYGRTHAIVLPLGITAAVPEICGRFDLIRQDRVYCTPVAGATQYQFRFAAPDSGWFRTIGVPRNWVRIAEMQTAPLLNGRRYMVSIRADQGFPGFEDDVFGEACPIGLTADPNCTALMDRPGVHGHSCGISIRFAASSHVFAEPVAGALEYRYSFSHAQSGFRRSITSTTNRLTLHWYTQPLEIGLTYAVTVSVRTADGWQTACGTVCPLTIIGLPPAQVNETPAASDEPLSAATFTLWPNPNNGQQLHIALRGLDAMAQQANLELIDMQGRTVHSMFIPLQDGQQQHSLELPMLTDGVYMLRINDGKAQLTKRLVIQR